jgi:KDO2-lipid IV(A) lauroyltransferase
VNALIYFTGRLVIRFIQCLPLRWVARLGRVAGGAAFYLDGRHRRVALQNLTQCFRAEKSPAEIRALARENFRRLGENYACAVKTAAMGFAELQPHLQFSGFEKLPPPRSGAPAPNIVAAIGHFGNFELYARIQDIRPDLQGATTYRALKPEGANRLLQSLRGQNGCRFFERRTEGAGLRQLLDRGGVIIGLLVDQHSRGWQGPFLGHPCHTNLAAAVLALRYDCDLFSIICHRVGLAQWRLEVGAKIETRANGNPRTSEAIMQDVNAALETAVRRDPANWFWVHRRWKELKPRPEKRTPDAPVLGK